MSACIVAVFDTVLYLSVHFASVSFATAHGRQFRDFRCSLFDIPYFSALIIDLITLPFALSNLRCHSLTVVSIGEALLLARVWRSTGARVFMVVSTDEYTLFRTNKPSPSLLKMFANDTLSSLSVSVHIPSLIVTFTSFSCTQSMKYC